MSLLSWGGVKSNKYTRLVAFQSRSRRNSWRAAWGIDDRGILHQHVSHAPPTPANELWLCVMGRSVTTNPRIRQTCQQWYPHQTDAICRPPAVGPYLRPNVICMRQRRFASVTTNCTFFFFLFDSRLVVVVCLIILMLQAQGPRK